MSGFILLEYGPIDEGYKMGNPQGFEDLVAVVEVGYVEASVTGEATALGFSKKTQELRG
jgi:hypothetical protein